MRLPKPLILQAGLTDEVTLRVRDGAIVIASAASPRAGWADAARAARRAREDSLIDEPTPTEFDRREWEWR